MTIIPTVLTLQNENPIIPLSRFAQLTFHSECQFFGIDAVGAYDYQCRKYWTKVQRDWVNLYLNRAQGMIEDYLGFKIHPTWITDEQYPIQKTYHTVWAHVFAGGIKAVSNIALAEAIDDSTDPEVIGPVATTVTNDEEIHIYHPGTDIELIPSKVTISGGNLTIEIPRCRLLLEAAMTNDEHTGLVYTDDSLFESTVDIKRVYNDMSTQAVYYKTTPCENPPCAEETQSGCILIKNMDTGHIYTVPANYAGGWTLLGSACISGYTHVKLNYYCGWLPENFNAETAMMQLAFSLMPDSPCACEWIRAYWTNVTTVPEFIMKDRTHNPFGLTDGAWYAYQWVMSKKFYKGSYI